MPAVLIAALVPAFNVLFLCELDVCCWVLALQWQEAHRSDYLLHKKFSFPHI